MQSKLPIADVHWLPEHHLAGRAAPQSCEESDFPSANRKAALQAEAEQLKRTRQLFLFLVNISHLWEIVKYSILYIAQMIFMIKDLMSCK